jgi:hypothetical protein
MRVPRKRHGEPLGSGKGDKLALIALRERVDFVWQAVSACFSGASGQKKWNR